jgi:hypothetical protein
MKGARRLGTFLSKLPELAGNKLAEALFAFGMGISAVISFFSNLVSPYADANYKYNRNYSFSGYIYDQNAGDAALLRMGYYKGSYNGCGWIAAYNAALLTGLAPQPADIIRYFDISGAAFVNGAFGINPLAVKMFFRKSGLKARIISFPAKTDKTISESKACVLAYLHSKGAHYVAVQYANGAYLIYNGPERSAPAKLASAEEWIAAKKYKPIALIAIGLYN